MAELYATKDRMLRKYSPQELVRLTGGPPNESHEAYIDDQVLQQAFEDAQDEIDPFLESVTGLPLDAEDIPGSLRMHACSVAYYMLHDNPTERAETDYERALQYLRDVRKGVRSLGLTDEGESPPDTGGVDFSGSDPAHERFYDNGS